VNKSWPDFVNNIQLPPDLDTWRIPGESCEAEEKIWQNLDQVFNDHGYTLWPNSHLSILASPGGSYPISSGFGYVTSSRGIVNKVDPAGTARRLTRFNYIVRFFPRASKSLNLACNLSI
jgi:hypothetical protein